jgi:anti-sigma B factor antagonist
MLGRADNTDSSPPTSVQFAIERRELDPRTSLVSVEGELDLASAPRLKWMLLDALGEGHNRLILDLSLATFMDSTALSVLVGVNRGLDDDGGLAIVCPRSALLKIFELSGMDAAFTITATLEQALARLHAPAADAPTVQAPVAEAS